VNGLQLLSPLSLIALAPLAGIIILLYLLRLRRREVTVSSTFLWRQAVQDIQANVPFQRLKRNLLLLLQLLALTAVVAALASPYFLSRGAGGRNVIVVVDASASMKATDVPGSRFEEARRQVAEMVNGLGRNDEMAIVSCGARPVVELSFSRDRRQLLNVVGGLQPGDCATNMRDGVLLALSLAARRPDATVCIFSDGAFAPLPPVASSAELRFVCLGRRSDNVAIVALSVSRAPDSPLHEVFVRLQSTAAEPRETVLSLYNDDQLLRAERVTLRAGESRVLTYEARLPTPGLMRAEVDLKDDLAADNVAYAAADAGATTSVLLVTPGNLFLEQGLLVLPGVSLYKGAGLPGDDPMAALSRYDVVVLDRVPLPATPLTGGVLLLGALGPGAPATGGAALDGPTISRWDQTHPVLAHLNLASIQMARAQALQPVAGARPLASVGEAPVIVARETAGARVVACGFSVLDTDWPLRVGFPVFLSNAVSWLAESGRRTGVSTVRPGQVLRAQLPADVTEAELTLPGGERRTVAAAGGVVSFSGTDRVGVYRLNGGGVSRRWAVDLRDPAESDLTPRHDVRLGEREVASAAAAPRHEQHLWPWLAVVALGLLLGEWHLYHRRV
jgi:Ca-activated chloride channel homolog